MKRYEVIPQISLMRRTPVAIRIDGKAFHTFCHHLNKPFDDIFIQAMQETTMYLCENIQNCVMGYTQSDEITLILVDYETLTTDAWFGYEVQKLCSIAASMATMKFNQIIDRETRYLKVDLTEKQFFQGIHDTKEDENYVKTWQEAVRKGACFDARCFNIPKEEVTNLVYWRQLDAIRNSIQICGQAHFSPKQLHGKSCEQIKEMLREINQPWEEIEPHKQRGTACWKDEEGWYLDEDMPILKGDGRKFLDSLIFIGD